MAEATSAFAAPRDWRLVALIGVICFPAAFLLTQHDAAVTGFDLYWDSNCTCARYRNEHRIPSR